MGNDMRRMLHRLAVARRKAASAERVSRREAGFTLVEMLVVLAIIGLIVGLVGPRVLNYLSDSKVKAARIQIDSFAAALDLYFLDVGRYPNTNEGMNALMQRPSSASAWAAWARCEACTGWRRMFGAPCWASRGKLTQ